MNMAYFSVELQPESRPLTATITSEGLFQYKRLPMGLKDLASSFQRCVDRALQGIPKVGNFVDDVFVGGRNQEEHDRNLDSLLAALSKHNFRINLEKCEFSKSEVTFLGHIIGCSGVRPNPRRVDAIVDAPAPRNLKELQKFLGFFNYFSNSIYDLATKAEPLRRLTRKNTEFQWDTTCLTAFNVLKNELCTNLLKAHFDPAAPTIVSSDASDVGIGGMLSQIQNGQEVPISFYASTFQPAERNYSTNEAETYACVRVCEAFEKLILGRPFTLRTDSSSAEALLKQASNTKKAKKFFRWRERLSEFDYTIEHCSGVSNVVADVLSRYQKQDLNQKTEKLATIKRMIQQTGVTYHQIKASVNTDRILCKVKNTFFNKEKKPEKSIETLPYLSVQHDMYLHDGIIYRRDGRVVLPDSMRRQVLHMAHEGHPGTVRMKRAIRSTYWWPGMNTEIERLVRHCVGCQRSQKSDGGFKVSPKPLPSPDKPWDLLSLDITGPFHTAPPSQRFIVVLMDHYSNFPEYKLLGTVDSRAIIQWLENVFSRYGYPSTVLTDNGPQFVSQDFESYLNSVGICHIRTPVYNPETNGRVECFNRFLLFGSQAMNEGDKWDDTVQSLVKSYRSIPLADNGKSPAELLHGFRMRLPYIPPEPSQCHGTQHDKKPSITSQSNEDRKPPKLYIRGPYRVGDKVLVRRPGNQVLKGQSVWSKPLRVIDVLGNYTYKVSDGNIWNARKMKRYYEQDMSMEPETNISPRASTATKESVRRSSRARKPVVRYQS